MSCREVIMISQLPSTSELIMLRVEETCVAARYTVFKVLLFVNTETFGFFHFLFHFGVNREHDKFTSGI